MYGFLPNYVISGRNLSTSKWGKVWKALASTNSWLTLTDITKQVELSRPTINNVLQNLIKLNLVNMDRPGSSAYTGRPPALFQLNPQHHSVVVLRVGYSSCEGQLVDAHDQILAQSSREITDPSQVIELLKEIIVNLRARPHPPISLVICTVMGIVYQEKVVYSASYPILHENRWQTELAKTFDTESPLLMVINDAKLAAQWMHQQIHIKGQNPECLVALSCTPPLGCGILFGGQLLEGAHGAAGELSRNPRNEWIKVDKMIDDFQAAAGQPLSRVLKPNTSYPEFAQELGTELGRGIGDLVMALDPSLVAVGGCVAYLDKQFTQAIQTELSALTPTPPAVQLLPTSTDPAIIGARLFAHTYLAAQVIRKHSKFPAKQI